MGPILIRVGIAAFATVATALGAGLIALGRYGDAHGAGQAPVAKAPEFVVKYRMAENQEFATYGEKPGQPESAWRTVDEAVSVARTLMAAPPCEAKIFNIRTGAEFLF